MIPLFGAVCANQKMTDSPWAQAIRAQAVQISLSPAEACSDSARAEQFEAAMAQSFTAVFCIAALLAGAVADEQACANAEEESALLATKAAIKSHGEVRANQTQDCSSRPADNCNSCTWMNQGGDDCVQIKTCACACRTANPSCTRCPQRCDQCPQSVMSDKPQNCVCSWMVQGGGDDCQACKSDNKCCHVCRSTFPGCTKCPE